MKKICLQCNKEYEGSEKQKYCGYECMHLSQRGRKMPHSEQWEKNKTEAIRKSAWKWVGKERPKSRETIKIAQDALKKWQKENPGEVRKHALANMPKDCAKEKNGNWRNGITALNYNWRTQHLKELKQWRSRLLDKFNHKCVLCGSSEKLEAHHIVPLAESTLSACEIWNGVILCRKCHQETDSWGSVKKSNKREDSPGLNIIIKSIPHSFQEYNTWGNYKKIEDTTYFLISDHGNDVYTILTLIHEMIECFMLEYKGIPIETVDAFDIAFEGDPIRIEKYGEPGNDIDSPYYFEHQTAEAITKFLCENMKIDYEQYNNCL